MSNEVAMWNKVMSGALSLPGVKINRTEFLFTTLQQYVDKEQLMLIPEGHRPIEFIPLNQIDKLADGCIKNHLTKVTAISAASGIPGGWALAGTIPADLAQYYYHVLVLSQKMAYLYGFPDLVDGEGKISEDAQNALTIFAGVMMGVDVANECIQKLARSFSGQVLKRLPRYALTKTVIYPMVKQVAKWIGVKITKETFAKGVSKMIPLVGAVLSGGLTYITFKPSAQKLKKSLHESSEMMQSTQGEQIIEIVDNE